RSALQDHITAVTTVDQAVSYHNRVVSDLRTVGNRAAGADPDVASDFDPFGDNPQILQVLPLFAMAVVLSDDIDIGTADKVVTDSDASGTGRNETAVGEATAIANMQRPLNRLDLGEGAHHTVATKAQVIVEIDLGTWTDFRPELFVVIQRY